MTTRPDWGPPGGESRSLVPSHHGNGALAPVSYGGNNGGGNAFAAPRGNWLTFDQARHLLPAGLAAKWSASATRPTYRLATVQESVHAILRRLDADEQTAFLQHFDASLSETAKAAVLDEISLGTPANARNAEPDEIVAFASTEAGASCVRNWSGGAPKKVGILLYRTSRLAAALSSDDFGRVDAWLMAEPEGIRAAVYRVMAG